MLTCQYFFFQVEEVIRDGHSEEEAGRICKGFFKSSCAFVLRDLAY